MPKSIKYSLWKKIINPWINGEMLERVPHVDDPRWQVMSLRKALILTLFTTSLPQLLTLEDKNSMRWSIETRIPFLDFHFVEAAMGCTSRQKLHKGKTKVIFRNAIASLIPPLVSNRKDKIGFEAPSNALFREERVMAFSRDIIFSDRFRKRPYWKWEEVKKIFESHIKGKVNCGDTIWKWINTELWLRSYFDN